MSESGEPAEVLKKESESVSQQKADTFAMTDPKEIEVEVDESSQIEDERNEMKDGEKPSEQSCDKTTANENTEQDITAVGKDQAKKTDDVEVQEVGETKCTGDQSAENQSSYTEEDYYNYWYYYNYYYGTSDDSKDEKKNDDKKEGNSDSSGQTSGVPDKISYSYDENVKGYVPDLSEEDLALWKLNYGGEYVGSASTSAEEESLNTSKTEQKSANNTEENKSHKQAVELSEKGKLKRKNPEWFNPDEAKNTHVYVSGIPDEMTEDEFREIIVKCGVLAVDVKTGKEKMKFYLDSEGRRKGDALITYGRTESVDLALDILDDYPLGKGKVLKVTRASFQLKGQYDPKLKPKRSKKDKEREKKMLEKKLAWKADELRGFRPKHERIVTLKNLFDPAEFEKEPTLILTYKEMLSTVCEPCGTVKRVIIHDRHADGVAQIIMASPDEADNVICVLNGRVYSGRKIKAEHHDGKTRYQVEEKNEERAKRLEEWEKYLLDEAAAASKSENTSTEPTSSSYADKP